MAIAISTDIGGTFTDLVAYDLDTGTIHQAKDYTDPDDLSSGIARCIDKSGLPLVDAPEFMHGSTVAINTAIERKGARTALLVTRGHARCLRDRTGQPAGGVQPLVPSGRCRSSAASRSSKSTSG